MIELTAQDLGFPEGCELREGRETGVCPSCGYDYVKEDGQTLLITTSPSSSLYDYTLSPDGFFVIGSTSIQKTQKELSSWGLEIVSTGQRRPCVGNMWHEMFYLRKVMEVRP